MPKFDHALRGFAVVVSGDEEWMGERRALMKVEVMELGEIDR